MPGTELGLVVSDLTIMLGGIWMGASTSRSEKKFVKAAGPVFFFLAGMSAALALIDLSLLMRP